MSTDCKILSKRSSASNFDLFESSDGVPEVFADGFHSVALGPQIAKVSFFTVLGIGTEDSVPVEQRHIKLHLVMPVTGLLDLALQSLQLFSQGNVGEAMKQHVRQLEHFVEMSRRLSVSKEK